MVFTQQTQTCGKRYICLIQSLKAFLSTMWTFFPAQGIFYPLKKDSVSISVQCFHCRAVLLYPMWAALWSRIFMCALLMGGSDFSPAEDCASQWERRPVWVSRCSISLFCRSFSHPPPLYILLKKNPHNQKFHEMVFIKSNFFPNWLKVHSTLIFAILFLSKYFRRRSSMTKRSLNVKKLSFYRLKISNNLMNVNICIQMYRMVQSNTLIIILSYGYIRYCMYCLLQLWMLFGLWHICAFLYIYIYKSLRLVIKKTYF